MTQRWWSSGWALALLAAIALAVGYGLVGRAARTEPPVALVTGTSGFYRLANVGGVWWWLDPEGKRFLSLGVNHIELAHLVAEEYREGSALKYGGDLRRPDGRPNLQGDAAKRFAEEAAQQVRTWGFNSLGANNPIPQDVLPRVAVFRPIEAGKPGGTAWPDPWDPSTRQDLQRRADAWAASRRDDRGILGVALTDGPRWSSAVGDPHPWVTWIKAQPGESPGKQQWIRRLKTRYATAKDATAVYGVDDASWAALAARTEWPPPADPDAAWRDEVAFLAFLAKVWYELVSDMMRVEMPNHVLLGDRFQVGPDLPDWLLPTLASTSDALMAEWNGTAEEQLARLQDLHARTGLPILLSDSSFAAPTERVPNPTGVRVGSHEEVGAAYASYLETMSGQPWFVGWHWCGYVEGSSDLGRFGGGLERQAGLVRADGTVYTAAVEPMTEANRRAPEIHAAVSGTPSLTCSVSQFENMRVTRIGDRTYEMRRGANEPGPPTKPISWIVTDEGVLVYDTANEASARVAMRAIRSMTDAPIRYVVYSHHHGTQLGGVREFLEEGTDIVAHARMRKELDLQDQLGPYRHRLNSIQFDKEEEEDSRPAPRPTITFDVPSMPLQLGDVDLEVLHMEGEAADYTVLWYPEERIVFVADLLAGGMPMVASPMKPVRDEVDWKAALEQIDALQPLAILRSHTMDPCDRSANYAAIHDQMEFLDILNKGVIGALNQGIGVEEAVRTIQIPPGLAVSPHLVPRYGTLQFAVRGAYERQRGWFDQNGSHVFLVDPVERAQMLVRDMGGPVVVTKRAAAHLAEERPQLALELLDLVLEADPKNANARGLKADALDLLAGRTQNPIEQNMLLRTAKIQRSMAAEGAP